MYCLISEIPYAFQTLPANALDRRYGASRVQDEAHVFIILTRLPCKIKWVDWNAAAAQARLSGINQIASVSQRRQLPSYQFSMAPYTSFSSFSSAIFTLRKMFSNGLPFSATRDEETGTSSSMAWP